MKKRALIGLVCATSLLGVGCPAPPQLEQVNIYRIEGDIYLPEGDNTLVAAAPKTGLIDWLNPSAQAATGLVKARAGLEVRLVRIDDTGKPVSNDPYVVTTTDANGHYRMDVSATEVPLPAPNIVVEVGSYGSGAYLRNFATQENLDLSPVTTAAVQLLADRNEPLYSMPLNVVEETLRIANESTQSVGFASIALPSAINTTLSSLKANVTLNERISALMTRVISGTVLAPNGRVASVPAAMRWDSLLVPPAEALTGLQAVGANIQITLSRIDNNGNVLGLPLATTRTRSDGTYSLSLPQDVSPSSQFIVSVGSGPSLLRAFVTGSANLNISPLTEATTRLVLNNGQILSQPKVPISEFTPTELITLLDQVQQSTSSTGTGGANNVQTVMAVIDPVVQGNNNVQTTLRTIAGVPGPSVNTVPQATNRDSVVLTGTARPGSLVAVTGGTSVVSQALAAGETSFSITVPLKRNVAHNLEVRATNGGEVSLPTIVPIRHDTLNPKIDITKIVARNPAGQSFQTIITGATKAIDDAGRATVVIRGEKLGNSTTVQTDTNGAFSANLAADSGDTLTIIAIDESGNQSQDVIVVGGPGPAITNVRRESAYTDRVLTVEGAGFDPDPTKNLITFISPATQIQGYPSSVDVDRRALVVAVPDGLVRNLTEVPAQIQVKATVNGIESNDNREFTLFPAVSALTLANLKSNGQAEFFFVDRTENNLFMSSQDGTNTTILSLDLNGNVLVRDVMRNVLHDSVFRDIALDGTTLLTSNFDGTLIGRPRTNPAPRPTYRISRYELSGTGVDRVATRFLGDSAELGSEPGAMAYNPNNNQLYVALPKQGKVMRMTYANGIFGRPEELLSGLTENIRDIALDAQGGFMYITVGTSVRMFKLTLNAKGEVDLTNSNFAPPMGNGNGRLELDQLGNVYVSVGTGLERIDVRGKRVNLIPLLNGSNRTTVGLAIVNNTIYVNQLNAPDLFRITP